MHVGRLKATRDDRGDVRSTHIEQSATIDTHFTHGKVQCGHNGQQQLVPVVYSIKKWVQTTPRTLISPRTYENDCRYSPIVYALATPSQF